MSYKKHLKPSFIKFGSQNQKLFKFKFQYQNGKKRKSGKRFSGLQNGVIRGLQIGVGFRDYKSGQGFQIGTKRFQIGAEITNPGKRDFKLGQRLQIDAE